MLIGSYEGDPLSPPEGEAACGEHPLTPSFDLIFPINLLMIIALLGDDRAQGAEAQCAKSPKRATACFS